MSLIAWSIRFALCLLLAKPCITTASFMFGNQSRIMYNHSMKLALISIHREAIEGHKLICPVCIQHNQHKRPIPTVIRKQNKPSAIHWCMHANLVPKSIFYFVLIISIITTKALDTKHIASCLIPRLSNTLDYMYIMCPRDWYTYI